MVGFGFPRAVNDQMGEWDVLEEFPMQMCARDEPQRHHLHAQTARAEAAQRITKYLRIVMSLEG